jgi:hypothetical protein
MDTRIKRAIFMNILFIILYVISDYAVWMRIPADMGGMQGLTGTFENLRLDTSSYTLTRYISISGYYRTPDTYQSMSFTSQFPNLPLIFFLTMLLANILVLNETILDIEKHS